MREFCKIDLSEKLDQRDLYGVEKISKIVDKSLLDISNLILQQDGKIIGKMKTAEIDIYMNIEMYFMLNDYLFWLDETGLHTGHNCQTCAKKLRAMFLLDALIKRWNLRGKIKQFESFVRFRADAFDNHRSIN